jgi:hypothetical protein
MMQSEQREPNGGNTSRDTNPETEDSQASRGREAVIRETREMGQRAEGGGSADEPPGGGGTPGPGGAE